MSLNKVLLSLLFFVFASPLPHTLAAGNWDFVIAPYALIPGIDGDTTINNTDSI